jgi:hypothetical protein
VSRAIDEWLAASIVMSFVRHGRSRRSIPNSGGVAPHIRVTPSAKR